MQMKILLSVLLWMFLCEFSMASILDNRVHEYIDIFENGTVSEQKEACNSLRYAGLSDTRLFDVIEKKVIESYKTTSEERISWLIIALGFSGQEKYENTLKRIINLYSVNSTYQKHAADSLKHIDWYIEWNEIISDESKFNPKETDEVNRFVNMLRSDDYLLIRIAAKRIHYQHLYPEYLLDVLQETIRNYYNDPVYDTYQPDAVAWMLKALAGSRNRKYIPVIIEVIENAKNGKIVSHAEKYLRYYVN